MSNYNFEIGTTLYTMLNIEDDLSVFPPHQDGFVVARIDVEAADSITYAHGWGEVNLLWGYVTTTMRATLRVYVPNRSARLYIRVRDDAQAWVYCDVVMEWPNENNKIPSAGIVPEFSLPCKIIENLGANP